MAQHVQLRLLIRLLKFALYINQLLRLYQILGEDMDQLYYHSGTVCHKSHLGYHYLKEHPRVGVVKKTGSRAGKTPHACGGFFTETCQGSPTPGLWHNTE